VPPCAPLRAAVVRECSLVTASGCHAHTTCTGYQPILHHDIPVVPLRDADDVPATDGARAADGDQACVGGSADTTTADARAGTARVIAGELDGVRGPAQTFTPVELIDVALPCAAA